MQRLDNSPALIRAGEKPCKDIHPHNTIILHIDNGDIVPSHIQLISFDEINSNGKEIPGYIYRKRIEEKYSLKQILNATVAEQCKDSLILPSDSANICFFGTIYKDARGEYIRYISFLFDQKKFLS